MNEDLKFIIESTEEAMEAAVVHLEEELVKIRGRANAGILDGLYVDYYGSNSL